MIGYNSRETCQSAVYDIQTQDLESQKILETRVYRNGEILATVRRGYTENESLERLQAVMSGQHEETCEKVREGSYALIFLWISRGVIAFEEEEYLKALEFFESVLSIDESQEEANAYLDKIQVRLNQDKTKKKDVLGDYHQQIEALVRSGKNLEAGRKEAILERLSPRSSSPSPKRQESETREVGFSVPFWNYVFQRIHVSKHLLVTTSSILLILCAGVIFTDAQIHLDPDYHFHLGKEYLEDNQTLSARNIFYMLLRQNPSSEETFLQFWETFKKRGDYPVATGILEKILRDANPPAPARLCLAEAYRKAHRFQEARDHYQQALKEGLPEAACKIGMGLCLLEQRNPAAAIDLWEEIRKNGTRDYRIDYCLGLAHQENERPGIASGYFLQALKKQPGSAHIYRALSQCLYGMHQKEKALELWEKADQLALNQETACFSKPGDSAVDDLNVFPELTRSCFPFPLI